MVYFGHCDLLYRLTSQLKKKKEKSKNSKRKFNCQIGALLGAADAADQRRQSNWAACSSPAFAAGGANRWVADSISECCAGVADAGSVTEAGSSVGHSFSFSAFPLANKGNAERECVSQQTMAPSNQPAN